MHLVICLYKHFAHVNLFLINLDAIYIEIICILSRGHDYFLQKRLRVWMYVSMEGR